MPPDLNSLPPSRTSSNLSIHQTRPAPAGAASPPSSIPAMSSSSPSHSLAAAATLNAGIQNDESRRSSSGSLRARASDRRRSSVRMNLNLNDPTLPGPGELQSSPGGRMHSAGWPASPQHQRAPSLGELHQELENEQEAQVNRLLSMIRQQQLQIQALQASANTAANPSSAIDDSTPTSERSLSLPSTAAAQPSLAHVSSASTAPRSRSPFPNASLSRQSSYHQSRGSSQANSPALRPIGSSHPERESNEWMLGGGSTRDEGAFYQAETQNLTRENQMLKLRIRELERQLTDLNHHSPSSHSPATPSNLARAPVGVNEDQPNPIVLGSAE